ncbi:MAG: hypothetical protein WDZ41_01570 [Candidatus Babeliales bacterium]
MKKSQKLSILFLFLITFLFTESSLFAGAGKGFGLFAGGAVTGALITSAVKNGRERRYYREPERVVIERQQQPVYIQQAPASAAPLTQSYNRELQETRQLIREQQEQLADQRAEIRRLERKINKQKVQKLEEK